jgi:hypothetical protein
MHRHVKLVAMCYNFRVCPSSMNKWNTPWYHVVKFRKRMCSVKTFTHNLHGRWLLRWRWKLYVSPKLHDVKFRKASTYKWFAAISRQLLWLLRLAHSLNSIPQARRRYVQQLRVLIETLLKQQRFVTARNSWETKRQWDRVQCSSCNARTHAFLLRICLQITRRSDRVTTVSAVCPDCCVVSCRFWLQHSQDLSYDAGQNDEIAQGGKVKIWKETIPVLFNSQAALQKLVSLNVNRDAGN